jgi:predicted transcriptional regulator
MMSKEPAAQLRRAPRRTGALLHIATHPEASNREIAEGIGIADDAQISRLLARMQDLGLIRNHAGVGNHGGANAWQLTAEGRGLLSATKGSLD